MEKLLISEDRYGQKANHLENNEFVDRLNSRYTVMILMLAILIVIGKLFVGNPIQCWTPAQFSGTHNDYTHSICWLKGSYYLSTDNITIPDRSQPRTYYVSYYQWTPFILLFMGMFFFASKLFWDLVTRCAGMDIRPVMKELKDSGVDKSVPSTSNQIYRYLVQKRSIRDKKFCGLFNYFGKTTLTVMYGLVKIYQIFNVLIQWIILHAFLAFSFTKFGYEAFFNFFKDGDWFESPRFPRVTMCDFMIRHLGSNQHWYAVQCSLPINMYNEKIFFFLWGWLILLFFINIVSIIMWLRSLLRTSRKSTVKKYLALKSSKGRKASTSSGSETLFPESFLDFLGVDGVVLLRLISYNTNVLVAAQVAQNIYNKFQLNESPPRTSMMNASQSKQQHDETSETTRFPLMREDHV